MSYRNGFITGVVATAAAAGGLWIALGNKPAGDKPPGPAVPATVSKPLKEEQITTVVLKPEALKSLGVETGTVTKATGKRSRVYGGEVTVRPGHAVSVTAPLGGVLKAPEKGVPAAGAPVAAGQTVFLFLPLLTPEGRANLAASKVDADGQVKTAQTALDGAQLGLTRAKQLLKDEAGSRRMLDDAQVAFDTAQQGVNAATARRDLLAKVVSEFEAGTAAPIPLAAPAAGVLRALSASAGQTVAAGAPLFDVVNTARVWVRVPVYAGDLPRLDAAADAVVTPLAVATGPGHPAVHVTAPPSANALAGTVDLFYELDNAAADYRPGHRVAVRLTAADPDDSVSVPWAAVLHDIHGGAWVYEQLAEGTFTRRRVEVRHVADGTAYLKPDSSPKIGTVVVTHGAAELFGTETGFSK